MTFSSLVVGPDGEEPAPLAGDPSSAFRSRGVRSDRTLFAPIRTPDAFDLDEIADFIGR
jgi:hypothetical protein